MPLLKASADQKNDSVTSADQINDSEQFSVFMR